MDDNSGCLGFIIAIAAVAAIVAAVIAAIVFTLICIAMVGSVAGVIIAIIHFCKGSAAVAAERKRLRRRFDAAVLKQKYAQGSPLIFEEHADKMYIMGPIFKDICHIISGTIKMNFSYAMDFSDTYSDRTFVSIAKKAFVIGKGVSIYVFGTLFSLALCAVFALLCLVGMAIIYPIIGIILFFETMYFKAKQINFRCTVCKKEYKLPKYTCIVCGTSHIRLKPGRYGIFRRRCLCGAHLPLVAKVKGSYRSSMGTKNKILLSDLHGMCPFCSNENNAGLSHAISIALVGGTNAGKTTFKVAFQYEFLDIEAQRLGIETSFPDSFSEDEYKTSRRCYEGKDFIAATNGAMNADITTFCVNLKHQGFISDRMLQVYDLPGERFSAGDVKEGWEHYSFTEGAVFLIDPFSLKSVREQNNEEIANSRIGICSEDMNAMIDSMIETLNNVKVKKNRNGKMMLPIALAISKVDTEALSAQCGDIAAEKLLSGAPGVFADKYEAMDYACRCFLSINGFDGFIQNLDNHFETVHFFSCSAVGTMPKASLIKFEPKNVLEIMQWMIIRADKKNIGSVWKPLVPVSDIPDERKRMYLTDRSYYDQFVLNAVNV
ncbi:MAG: hypothetical protein K2J80_11160 [Oscillospiraceae bacterium]|nr:hypothetical protein [Oscillospiraceae bacterium]